MGMTGSGTLASQAGNATEKRSHQLFLLQSWKSSRLCLVQVSSTRDNIIFDHNFPSSVIFIQTEAAAAWPPTLVKFHRWMKCLATSRAAFPWTTEAMSCQGILGVLCLSMKSKEAETGSSDLKKSILHQEWDHQWCAYHRKAYLAESSPCAQSCSSLSRARIACSHATLWPPQAHFALGQRLKNNWYWSIIYHQKKTMNYSYKSYFSEFTQPGEFIFDQFLLYLFETIIWSIYNDNNGLFFEHFSFPDVAPVLFKQRTIFMVGFSKILLLTKIHIQAHTTVKLYIRDGWSQHGTWDLLSKVIQIRTIF